ncbi:hypothetical protein BD769DRAFT_1370991, partial [Suillus cothurnatus]
GPDLKNLAFDLKNGFKTPWNSKIIDLLFKEIQRRCSEERWPFQKSEAYFREILHDCYKHLHTIWTAVQPKITAKGTLETPTELEQRLIMKKDETLKVTCQMTRQRNVCSQSPDNCAWQWLQQLVKTLGEGGMSSEESDVENDIRTVLRVKNMVWR